MAYNFTKSDGTAISVADSTIDTTNFSIGLLGKNVSNYGFTIARNTIHMLENFAHDVQPANPITGQLWFDTASNNLNVFGNGLTLQSVVTFDPSGSGDILPHQAGISNVGSVAEQFNNMWATTFNGQATSARYADLAERYEADRVYAPGTVLSIGGEKQVTQAVGQGTLDVFGVVSTAPGLMLNAEAGSDETHPYVALAGQVPVRVVGAVHKGQRLIASNISGCAEAINDSQLGTINHLAIIGRALENKDSSSEGKVLVAVGAK